MKFTILVIGHINEEYLTQGVNKYLQRLKHYGKIEYKELKDIKPHQNVEEFKKRESEMILSHLKSDDILVLLDEKGKMYDSVSFSGFIEKLQIHASKNVVFVVGGAFGHHKILHDRANFSISLSLMTFSHQMVRLFFVEQLYRAFTILRGEKYHNN